MKIQTKIVLLLAVLIIFFTNVVYGLLRWQIQKYHRDIEKNYIVRMLDNVEGTFEESAEELYELWLRSGGHERSIRIAEGAGAGGERLFDADERAPAAAILADTGGRILRFELSQEVAAQGRALLASAVKNEFQSVLPVLQTPAMSSGFLAAQDTFFVLAVAPVVLVDSQRIGSVILADFMEYESATLIHQDAEVALLPIEAINNRSAPAENEPAVSYGDARTISASRIISDIEGKPLAALRITGTRVFLLQEERTLLLALLSNTVVGLLVAFIVLLLLQKLVIGRIDALVEQVSTIRRSGDFSSRLEITGQDEVGMLAGAFNEALDKLEEMARRIEDSEERYSLLVEQSRDGVAVIIDDEMRYANRRLLEMLGYRSASRLSGEPLGLIAPFERKRIGRKIKRQYSLKRPKTLETKLVTEKGGELDVEVDLVSAMYLGESAVFLYIRDVTEDKRMNRYLQRVDKLTSLGQLSSGIAHEIRTPLASIQLNLDNMLQSASLDEEQRKLLNNSMEGIRRISDIVQGTLDFARHSDPLFAPLDMRVILDEVLTFMDPNLRKSNVVVDRSFEEGALTIQADKSQLNQAFLNIILNAIQAMPHGGNLHIWLKSIKDKRSSLLEVGFKDTGFGIAPDLQRRIFDPFYTTKYKGVGLGLSIVHRIFEEHGATVDVESAPGRGTTFIIRFPINNKEKR